MKNLTVEDLRQEFDKVKLHYATEERVVNNSEHPVKIIKVTRAGLVKDNKVFVGISECDFRDQFNKSLGRQIALGRAIYSYNVEQCNIPMRGKRRLCKVFYADTRTVDQILKEEIFKKEE